MILFYYYFYYYHYKQFLYRISISIYYILLLIYVLLKKTKTKISNKHELKNKTHGMSKAKKFNKNESEVALKIMDEPRICSQINLEFKMKRENLQLKIFDR